MFYYAVLNENLFVVDLVASETAITDSTYIAITEDQYTNGNLMWLYYKPESGEFIVCDNWIGSSDWIFYKNTDRPITPKFDEIDSAIAGKAAAEHTHDLGDITETDSQKIMTAAERTKLAGIAENANNYVHPATHAASMITGLADVATSGNYNDLLNKPEVPEAYTHPATHPASMITGLSDVATSGDYQDLANKPTIPTIPESLPANGGDADTVDGYHASAFAAAQHNHDAAYASASHTHNDLAAISHTHGQNDITGLAVALNGKASASHTHGEATTAAAGFMSAADKTKLNGIAAGANAYTHPASHPASMITGLSGVATSGSYNDLSNKPTIPAAYTHPASHPASMITGLAAVAKSGSYADLSNKPSTFTPAAHTHAQSEITGLTSALNGKAATGHTHNTFLSDTSASTFRLVYVATNGSDSNDGLSASAPMATIKGVIRKYSDKYKMLDISLADGTYTENIGTIAVDQCSLAIRSTSGNKDAVIINMSNALEVTMNETRIYNLTLNVTATGVRPICVNAGNLFAYNVRINVPTSSTMSCINVYNGSTAFVSNCVLNSGTATNSGAAVYGNQALLIKAINCTSERKVTTAFHANNGSDIEYTATMNATNMAKQSSYGKCIARA